MGPWEGPESGQILMWDLKPLHVGAKAYLAPVVLCKVHIPSWSKLRFPSNRLVGLGEITCQPLGKGWEGG